jgi:hypothetical protein
MKKVCRMTKAGLKEIDCKECKFLWSCLAECEVVYEKVVQMHDELGRMRKEVFQNETK